MVTNAPLERAAPAAHKAWRDYWRMSPLTWDESPETMRDAFEAVTIAALRVMADDLRALHRPVTFPSGTYTCCVHCDGMMWPCPTIRILDAYVEP